MANQIRPIIIKKIKNAVAVHHGGQWKIAYADFVTAMMAFFLLMWLLGSSSKDRIARHFRIFPDSAEIMPRGGQAQRWHTSVIQGGGKDLTRTRVRSENTIPKR